jgi:hypothetical protein
LRRPARLPARLAAGFLICIGMLWGCSRDVADSFKAERDIRSELGADVAVTSGTVYDTNARDWRTTVYVHVRGDAGARPKLESDIERIVKRDFRAHVTLVRFD